MARLRPCPGSGGTTGMAPSSCSRTRTPKSCASRLPMSAASSRQKCRTRNAPEAISGCRPPARQQQRPGLVQDATHVAIDKIKTGTLGHSRQFSYLFLREVEPDSGVDPGHGADGDGDFLAAPQVPLLEQHVGHPVIARVDEEALHPPDLTIDGVDLLPGPHLLPTHRDNVFEDRRPPQRCAAHAP